MLGIDNMSRKLKKKVSKLKMTSAQQYKCLYNHDSVLFHSEKNYQRYYKEGSNLCNVKCAQNNNEFQESDGFNTIVLNVTNSIYICLGGIKFECRHVFCYITRKIEYKCFKCGKSCLCLLRLKHI